MRGLKKILVVLFFIVLGYIVGAVIATLVDIFLVTGSMATTAYGGIELIATIIAAVLGIRRVAKWPDAPVAAPATDIPPPPSPPTNSVNPRGVPAGDQDSEPGA